MSRRTSGGKRRSDAYYRWPGSGGLRWALFVVFVYVGVQGAAWLSTKIGWIVWVIFGVWWIPMSLDMSSRLLRLPRGIVRVEVIRNRNRRRAPALASPKCSHCGERVSSEQAVCPYCYRDLKTNCERCGKIIAVEEGLCETCRKEEGSTWRRRRTETY